MKLLYLSASPFARKVLVFAQEAGLADRVEVESAETSPLNSNSAVLAHNPLGKVPVLIRDDGRSLYDSAVICEYLNSLTGTSDLIPPAGEGRWQALRLQALADGLSDAAIALRREENRPSALQWHDWKHAHARKLVQGYDFLEQTADFLIGAPTIGEIALATALEWIEFRAAGPSFRSERPRLSEWFNQFACRDSMQLLPPS